VLVSAESEKWRQSNHRKKLISVAKQLPLSILAIEDKLEIAKYLSHKRVKTESVKFKANSKFSLKTDLSMSIPSADSKCNAAAVVVRSSCRT
jgi:hypothetical protein